MAEVFANKIRTSVASAYTAASGTLVVASATGMPATGNFRIRLGNTAGTLLRCTARSGTTLTVDVEQDDGNAAIGDTVRLVNTAAAMLALKADAIAGSGGSGGGFPWWPTIVDPTVPAWTWQNQGSAAVVQANGIVFLSSATTVASVRSRLISTPATPWTATLLMQAHYTAVSNNQYAGLVLRESGTGKLYTFANFNGAQLRVDQWTNDTTTFDTPFSATLTAVGHLLWLRIADDGTNLLFSTSADGRNFVQRFSQGRTAFMAAGPNQFGLFANTDIATEFVTSFYHWNVA